MLGAMVMLNNDTFKWLLTVKRDCITSNVVAACCPRVSSRLLWMRATCGGVGRNGAMPG